jgi:glycosyltransferase involved in cell wall biosynthesis
MKDKQILISLVIPMYNEEQSIPLLLDGVLMLSQEVPEYDFEVVLVDDCSTDNSVEEAKFYPGLDIKIVSLDKNRGQQFSICVGLRVAQGDYVVTMDADGQHPFITVKKFLHLIISNGYDLVQAYQVKRTHGSFAKRLLSNMFWSILRLNRKRLESRNVGDFRIMNKVLVERINSYADPKILRLLVPELSRKTHYIPFTADPRLFGETKYTFSKMMRLAIDSFVQVSVAPLRAVAVMGILSLGVTLLYSFFVVYQKMHGETIPGWSSLILLVGFFGSLNLLSICIIGEYVTKLYLRSELISKPFNFIQNSKSE